MESFKVDKAITDLPKLLEQVSTNDLPVQIVGCYGSAVLVSQAVWNGLQETLYLQSIPGFVDMVRAAETDDDWVSEAEFLEAGE